VKISAPQPSPKKKILIADDELDIRKLARVFLTEMLGMPCEIIEAPDGAEAVKLALQKKPDLILLDVMMPVMDGFEACRRLKEDPETCGIPVVFLTGTGDEAAIEKGLDLGGEAYVVKPFHAVTMVAQIKEILARGSRN
jgi:CheY-like chemotaxis protein